MFRIRLAEKCGTEVLIIFQAVWQHFEALGLHR